MKSNLLGKYLRDYRLNDKLIVDIRLSTEFSDYEGKVPSDFDELLKLPGVGRKTASVVL